MKILFTGASSFTGCWFVKQLVEQGHEVTAIFRQSESDYIDLRKKRIDVFENKVECVFNTSFGNERFIKLIQKSQYWDVLCHHAADVEGYKTLSFDIASAVHHNCYNMYTVMSELKSKSCNHLVMTGSVFEQNEGMGDSVLEAFNPYGFSKGMSFQIAEYLGNMLNINVSKFVIPNPFGMLEEPRFTNYLCKSWAENTVPIINTPDYVRDNIHISLLANAYVKSVEFASSSGRCININPSGYVETQGAFATRFAYEIGRRLDVHLQCRFAFQDVFGEPRLRFNTSPAMSYVPSWNESDAWDELANYYDYKYQLSNN
ncbi:NAD dependent epimerase/dehydratase family protein [Poriferisphaera corsica]|uniref:UDP-glucose 4-epimerase n=1 Tax=Poriferisphaera corsica TaxID=2528020 RepID=A0A517YWE0_9BACT|nr:NAD(P)-dependent oxidoreductase [Poriferisphaera corsica]QDU34541.1 NAD dependent epimerase/dehydratase family protein [Poriferisphaera corsica]